MSTRALLKGLYLAKTMRNDLFGCEKHNWALATLKLLNSRFLHSFTQMLNQVFGILIALKKVWPGILDMHFTSILWILIFERTSRWILVHFYPSLFSCSFLLYLIFRLSNVHGTTTVGLPLACISALDLSSLQIEVECRASTFYFYSTLLTLGLISDNNVLTKSRWLISLTAQRIVRQTNILGDRYNSRSLMWDANLILLTLLPSNWHSSPYRMASLGMLIGSHGRFLRERILG